MSKNTIIVLIIVIIFGAGVYLIASNRSPVTVSEQDEVVVEEDNSTSENVSDSEKEIENQKEYYYTEQAQNSGKTIYCRGAVGTESFCELYAANTIDPQHKLDLKFYVETESSVIPSPDQSYVLLIKEKSASILNTRTWEIETVFEVEMGTLGVYSGFPMFYGQGKWLDNNTVELSVYSSENNILLYEDGETITPEPVSKEVISI